MKESSKKIMLHGCELTESEYGLYMAMVQPYVFYSKRGYSLLMQGKIDQSVFKCIADRVHVASQDLILEKA